MTMTRKLAAAFLAAAAALALMVAATPASAKKLKYGFVPQTSLSQSDYQQMDSLKTDLIRAGLTWPAVQPAAGDCTPQGGACDWSQYDQAVGAAASNGIGTMLTIYGSAGFVGPFNEPPLKDLGAWSDFIEAAVQRYGPGGAFWSGPYQTLFGSGAPVIEVEDWLVWNEQSSFQFFKPKPNVKKYAKILIPASKALRAGGKRVNVLLGGMFPDTGPKGIRIEDFLEKLYKTKGIKDNTFDGVSVHPYAKDSKALGDQLGRARKAMNKSGGKKDSMWISEIGYSSDGPKGKPVVKKGEKGQAKAITDAYKFLKKKGKKYKLEGSIYFTWQDVPPGTSCRFCSTAGLLDENGQPKKAFNAYKKATK